MTTIQHPLHIEALSLTAEERKITSLVIANLQKISNQKLHLRWGYSSLFEYCTRALGYSEACAYRRIAAMKISQELPEVKQQLEAGTINLTNLTMAQSLISKIEKAGSSSLANGDKREIIKQIERTSKQEAERRLNEIARAKGVEVIKHKDQVRMQGAEVRLEFTIARETFEKLERIKNLRAHKNANPSFAELLNDMAEIVLNKMDPLRTKVKVVKVMEVGLNEEIAPDQKSLSLEQNRSVERAANPRYISSQLKAKIWQRDQGQCTFRESNRKCESRHLLQIDHVRPVLFGGQATEKNLRLLCHAHHQLRADEM